jgi:hypothetical protein
MSQSGVLPQGIRSIGLKRNVCFAGHSLFQTNANKNFVPGPADTVIKLNKGNGCRA